MKVELDQVKDIVRNLEFKNGDNSDFCCGWNECLDKVLEKLDQLAYGKTYKCMNCGEDIYFVKESDRIKYYKHVGVGRERIRCEGKNNWAYDEIAMPAPESMNVEES